MNRVAPRSFAIGIDPGANTGWAIVMRDERGEHLLGCRGEAIKYDYLDVTVVGANVMVHEVGYGLPIGVTVAIEDQYLDKDPSAMLKLARLSGRLAQEFERRGARVVFVPAQTWQTKMLGKFGGRKRADRKKAAAILARSLFPEMATAKQDACDAAIIALYALRFLA